MQKPNFPSATESYLQMARFLRFRYPCNKSSALIHIGFGSQHLDDPMEIAEAFKLHVITEDGASSSTLPKLMCQKHYCLPCLMQEGFEAFSLVKASYRTDSHGVSLPCSALNTRHITLLSNLATSSRSTEVSPIQ